MYVNKTTKADFTVEPNREPVRHCWGWKAGDLYPNPKKHEWAVVADNVVDGELKGDDGKMNKNDNSCVGILNEWNDVDFEIAGDVVEVRKRDQ